MTTAEKNPVKDPKSENGNKSNGNTTNAGKDPMANMAAALGDKPAAAGDGKPAKPPKDDTPKEIKTNEDLIKAIYSSRNNLFCPVQGVDFPIAIVKSDLVNALKELDQAGAAPYNLVKRADGSGADLVLMKKAGSKT